MYTKEKLGKELKAELEKGYEIIRISRWAFRIFNNDSRDFRGEVREIVKYLFSMEDDPQFEFTEEDLHLIAEKLINNEENIIQQFIRKSHE